MKYRLLSSFAASSSVLAAGLLLSAPASAQEESYNWMREYVELRVHAMNVRTLGSGGAVKANLVVVRPRIVGGTVAGPHDNPFQVALLKKSTSENFQAQFCGGTLIKSNIVVTAAHCSDFVTQDQVQVLTGTRNLDGTGTRHNVSKIAVHPDWNFWTFENDVAVWTLSSDAHSTSFATLATGDGPVGEDFMATGWGALTENGSFPIKLRKVKVPLVSRENCNDANSYSGKVTKSMNCAGRDAGGKDSCQADSGGPLTRGSGNTMLTGITSWGIGCARPNLFGVYTRVSDKNIRSFINEHD